MKPKNSILVSAALLMLIPLLTRPLSAQERKREEPPDTTPFKLSTDLVSLSVTVTDPKGQPIVGLRREDFKLYENGVEQPLNFFSAEEAPVCWGIILDQSTSMSELIHDVYRTAVHVVDQGTARDETFIMTFNNQVKLVTNFISDKDQLQNAIQGLEAGGRTALWDAIDLALDRLKQAAHRKKVLVVVTDGKDNNSRIKLRDLIARAREENVLIYAVGMLESDEMLVPGARNNYWRTGVRGPDPRRGLEKLAKVTGARAHFITDAEQCREAVQAIAGEIGHQYSLGYYPDTSKADGKWRKIRVVVSRKSGKTKYITRTRTGYHASKAEAVKTP